MKAHLESADAPQVDHARYSLQQLQILREKFKNNQTDAQMRRKSVSRPSRPTLTASS
jgi:hypothetical protein